MAVTANLLIFFILLLTYCNIVISTCLKLEIFKSRAGFCFCWRREGDLAGAKAKKTAKMAGTGKKVMTLGMDNNEPSFYALQWTLDHFFVPFGQDPPFKLLIIHAQPRLASVVGFTGPGLVDVIPIMEADSKKRTQNVVDKAREVCNNKGVSDVVVEVIEGDARNVMCDAVDRHHASMLVVCSHNYGAVKRALLGSVSDHCAHNAPCSVLIVKQPKH
ncbi:universal stress protein PHOS34-like [Populus nigra]|uniref:universal stress protein PHOS34-like n=1 Tax=Populus nigra TaxID=3691 RepID=UPI002B27158C|nr:universal stress protein PHOS34-like [Populus nigra]